MNHYPLYPARRQLSLDGAWEFAWLGADADLDRLSPGDIRFAEQTAVPGVFDVGPRRAGARGVGLYRKRFRFPLEQGHPARLRIGGLGLSARLWFDGRFLDTVRLPYSSLAWDIVGEGDEHTLVVAVDNRFDAERVPLFRPDYDFYGYGGIYRGVTVETLPACRVERVQVRTLSVKEGRVLLRILLAGELPATVDLKLRFDDGDFEGVRATPAQGVVELDRAVREGQPWSLATPHLHTVEVVVGDDCIIERFGLRTVEARDGKILLNGEPVFLRGVNRHEAHPEFGPVQPPQLISDDIQWLKQLGCNFVRCVHYPQSQDFLDRCDEAGLLVWQESLGWNNTESEAGGDNFRALQQEQTRRMAIDGFNHPSIILWGFLNEGCSDTETGRALYRELAATLRRVDQTRLLSFASNRHQHDLCFELVDVMAMTLYPGWIGRRRDWYGPSRAEIEPCVREMAEFAARPEWQDKPFLVAEIGVCALYGCHDAAAAQWSEEFQAAYLAEVCRAIATHGRFAGLAIWQFCDTRSFVDVGDVRGKPRGFNCAGLLDEYRRPKLAFAAVKRAFDRLQEDGSSPDPGTVDRVAPPGTQGKGSQQ